MVIRYINSSLYGRLQSTNPATKQEQEIINYHTDTVKQGKQLINKDGSVTTVYSTGIKTPDGKFVSVPGYNRDSGKIMNEEEAYNFWKKDIEAGKFPVYNSGEELNKRSKELHKFMEAPDITPDLNLIPENISYFESTLLPSVFKKEGGYSTDKSDKGNYLKKDINSEFIGTNHGISADMLAKYRDKPITAEDMKNLTVDEAKNIYKKEFYTSKGIDKLPKELQEIVFHGVVNSGGHAISVVQGLLGLKQDGIVGPKTMEAMANAKFTKQEFKDALLNKYKTFDTWKEHGQGWTNRFEDLAR